MANLVPTLVLTFVNATTPAPQLEAQSLKAIEASVGHTPATALVQQSSATTINVGNFKAVLQPAQFRAAADSAGAATGCKVITFQAAAVGKSVDKQTGKVSYGSTPNTATLDCNAK